MQALKIITTIFNILFAMIILWFCTSYSWQEEQDRYQIAGLGSMFLLYLLDSFLIWV